MNKLIKILLVTVLFSLLPVANLFALSKEATEVIEAMRMRLNQQGAQINQETPKQTTSADEYVPGKELAEVLARIRRNRYARHSSNVANSTESHITNISIKPIKDSKEEEEEEEKVEVSKPEEQISQNTSNEQPTLIEATTVPETTPLVAEDQDETEASNTEKQSSHNPDELVIIEAMEADDSEAYSIPIDNSKADIVDNAPTAKKKSDEYVPGQLLEQSVKRIRHSRRRNTPASYEIDSAIENYEKRLAEKNNSDSQQVMSKASEEIEELFNNPEKRAQIAEEGRERYNSQKMNSEVDNDKIDDEKFNDYISKYDFKMPENYRIVVE